MCTQWDKKRQNIKIGDAIKFERKKCAISQAEVAKNTNVTQTRLSQFESGVVALTVLDAFTLCNYYNININKLKDCLK